MDLSRRDFAIAGLAAAAGPTLYPALAQAAPAKGGVITVATIGEPPTLDPVVSTADLVGMIAQHMFETLFTFDSNWKVTPLLAAGLPTIAKGGTEYTIKLRQGVKFHDGSPMTVEDVLASLKRWMKIASRGQQVAPNVSKLEKVDAGAVRITLKKPYAPLAALLAFNNSAAVIMPANKLADTLTAFIGTGPYKLKAHVPDRYIQLVRFDAYASPPGAPDGYGGGRHPDLAGITFVPVPDANTRTDGALAGQYHYADSLPVEAYDRLTKSHASLPLLLKPFGWPQMVMNTKQGGLAKVALRQAVQAALSPKDMLEAAFGTPRFYAVDGALYPKNYVWHTDAGIVRYGAADPAKAKALMKQGGYDGSPIRLMASRQYPFHYKIAQVAEAYLQQAGFKVDLQVMDWATLIQRRGDPKLWEIFITHSPFLPEPALDGFMSDDFPGWWATPQKDALVAKFNSEADPAKRVKLWAQVQALFYAQAPLIKVGDFNSLAARSPKLKGLVPAPWPYFWNVTLA
ncbi:MAG TPA: ABC transporter substrate-binding protein [Acetobacteraceae bacterium]|nr:ABC transporter substrate-binding protein [Acetobacteraceae bacterium]